MVSDVRILLQTRGIQVQEKKDRYNYLILCPFHKDKNASCSVNKEKGFFKCWSCGEKGSIAKLIAKIDGIEEKEAWSVINGTEAGGKVFVIKKEEYKKSDWKSDPLEEKYYEMKDIMYLLLSRKKHVLRLGKELNKHLDNEIWLQFRERQKQLKESEEPSIEEAGFDWLTNYIESEYSSKKYKQLTRMVKLHNYQNEFNLARKLIETQEYKDYKEWNNQKHKLLLKMYTKVKKTLNENLYI